MKLSSQETVEVHMSPPSLARLKGSIVVDMGNRGEIDLRVKSNGATNVDLYSPNKKGARPEPVSRIHLIPLLMIFVFFILWAGSSGAPFSLSLQMRTSWFGLRVLLCFPFVVRTDTASFAGVIRNLARGGEHGFDRARDFRDENADPEQFRHFGAAEGFQ